MSVITKANISYMGIKWFLVFIWYFCDLLIVVKEINVYKVTINSKNKYLYLCENSICGVFVDNVAKTGNIFELENRLKVNSRVK